MSAPVAVPVGCILLIPPCRPAGGRRNARASPYKARGGPPLLEGYPYPCKDSPCVALRARAGMLPATPRVLAALQGPVFALNGRSRPLSAYIVPMPLKSPNKGLYSRAYTPYMPPVGSLYRLSRHAVTRPLPLRVGGPRAYRPVKERARPGLPASPCLLAERGGATFYQ